MVYKQVIVVRRDLNLGKGKLCAQVAHASLEAALITLKKNPNVFYKWYNSGAKKVVLKVNNLEELLEIYNKAKESGLTVSLIRDAGLTQIPSNTITCIGIGPDLEEKIDKITGKLKLL